MKTENKPTFMAYLKAIGKTIASHPFAEKVKTDTANTVKSTTKAIKAECGHISTAFRAGVEAYKAERKQK